MKGGFFCAHFTRRVRDAAMPPNGLCRHPHFAAGEPQSARAISRADVNSRADVVDLWKATGSPIIFWRAAIAICVSRIVAACW